MKIKYMFIIVFFFLFISLNNAQEKLSTTQRITILEKKVVELQQLVDSLIELYTDKDKDEDIRYTIIDLAQEKGYQIIKTNLGFILLVVLEKVETFLDGYKIELRIGNPYNILFSGVVLNIYWGKYFSEIKQVKPPELLIAGAWQSISFNISPFDKKQGTKIKLFLYLDEARLK